MSTLGQVGRCRLLLAPLVCLGLLANEAALNAASRTFPSYASVKPILDELGDRLPADLGNANEAKWLVWARRLDKGIRARLEQGDLDSMVNLLLLGTSFTKQPRIRMEALTEASKAGILRARVDDLVAGLRNPSENERLVFLQGLLRSQGVDPTSEGSATGVFVYNNLMRVVQERRVLAEHAADSPGPGRSSLFQDRGVSLDTGIFPDFSIEQSLRDLKARGMLREGQVTRVAVIGPGLDFIDKNEQYAFDYYPPQTVQPFALYDSLLGLGLARAGSLSLTILDISPRVIEHVRHARERARTGIGYTIQLPRERRRWPPELVSYWGSLGDRVGAGIPAIRPPDVFPGLETRAIRVRPDVVLASEPVDLDIVLERLNVPVAQGFDLIVSTNVFVYYSPFEQSLALENAGAMLKPGGLLLTNDRLHEFQHGSMRFAGFTPVPFDSSAGTAREGVGWYQKK